MHISKLLDKIEDNILDKADIHLKRQMENLPLRRRIANFIRREPRYIWITPISGPDCAGQIQIWVKGLQQKYQKQLDEVYKIRQKDGRWTTRLLFKKKELEAVLEFIAENLL